MALTNGKVMTITLPSVLALINRNMKCQTKTEITASQWRCLLAVTYLTACGSELYVCQLVCLPVCLSRASSPKTKSRTNRSKRLKPKTAHITCITVES